MNRLQLKPQLWIILPALAAVLIISTIFMISIYHLRLKEKHVTSKVPPVNHAYNIKLDSLEIHYSKVGKNQNLSNLLSPYIPAGLIDKIAKGTGDIFDVRKMHS